MDVSMVHENNATGCTPKKTDLQYSTSSFHLHIFYTPSATSEYK